MKSSIAPLFAAALVAGPAIATPLVQEDFSAPDSTPLVGQPGWTETPLGGSSNPITIVGGQVTLNEIAGGQDATLDAGATLAAGQTWYAGFDLSVDAGTSVVNFAHFTDSTVNNSFTSMVRVAGTVPGPGDYGLSIINAGGVTEQKWATNLDFDTTYRVVIAYDFDSGTSQMWVDPTNAGSTSVTALSADVGRAIDSFGLRQSSGAASNVTIDNISIATDFNSALIPEPGSLALLSLAGLTLLRRRRG